MRDTGNLRNLVGKQAIPADSLAVTVRCKLPEGSTEGNTVSPNQPTMDESYNNYNYLTIKVVRILGENSKNDWKSYNNIFIVRNLDAAARCSAVSWLDH